MTSEMKFTPFWIDAPQKASTGALRRLLRVVFLLQDSTADITVHTDIERYSDRFKMGRASADGTLTATLASLHESRKLDKGLLPNAAFEAVFEKKKRTRVGGEGEAVLVRLRVRCRRGEIRTPSGEGVGTWGRVQHDDDDAD